MRNKRYWLPAMVVFLSLIAGCADTGGSELRRSEIRDCPPGFVLVCESREDASKAGPEEEIPEYEYCRCEQAY